MINKIKFTEEEIWDILSTIPDPEIPVISITELGVLRKVEITENKVITTITPTYSGCPAMKTFEDDIVSTLNNKGINNIEIKTILYPPWTTDWIPESALEKLRKFGIAPPIKGTQDKGVLFSNENKEIPCPQCKSKDTYLKSQFSSTACKALYQCNNCLETFDYFKCI